jgi:DNA (cytosine-5)-methyltransferase 1
VTLWPTPRASYNENRTTQDAPSHGVTHGATLAGTAGQWATPTSRDWKDGANPSLAVATNSLLGRQDPRTPMAGDESLPPGQTSRRRLNPRFVEWLMGCPEGWVDLTSSTSSETV